VGKKLTLYIPNPEAFDDDLEAVFEQLEKRGVNLDDQRGYPSISKLFRMLVKEKRDQLEEDTVPDFVASADSFPANA